MRTFTFADYLRRDYGSEPPITFSTRELERAFQAGRMSAFREAEDDQRGALADAAAHASRVERGIADET